MVAYTKRLKMLSENLYVSEQKVLRFLYIQKKSCELPTDAILLSC